MVIVEPTDEDEEEQEELGKINNARSDQAFAQCKDVMKADTWFGRYM